MLRKLSQVCGAALATAAWSDRPSTVEPVTVPAASSPNAVHHGENNAPVYWNAVARQLVGT